MVKISPIVSSDEESDSDSDQMPSAAQNKSQPQPAVNPPSPPSSSDTESSSDSDYDGPNSNVAPVAASKRKRKTTDPLSKKRRSRSNRSNTSKKNRLWSEEDEIVLLKGLISYSAKYNCDPTSETKKFHDFMRETLPAHITHLQLYEKVRGLKRKYENNRGRREGKERSFANPHEQSVYDLSHEMWKNAKIKTSRRRTILQPSLKTANTKAVKVESGGAMEETMLLNGREMYETGEGVEGEEEWEKLKMEEMQVYQKLLELRLAQTKLVLKNMKARGGD